MKQRTDNISDMDFPRNYENDVAAGCLARAAWPGMEAVRWPDVDFTVSEINSPIFNMAFGAWFSSAEADGRILSVLDRIGAGEKSINWMVGPLDRPETLGDRLQAHGFERSAETTAMGADLAAMTAVKNPDGFEVSEANDSGALWTWSLIMAQVFGFPEFLTRAWFDMHNSPELKRRAGWRCFLGRMNGHAAAVSSCYQGEHTAGIAGVSVLPGYRGRGLGAAITGAALDAGRKAGYTIAGLYATEAAYGLYERMGFIPYYKTSFYMRKPG